MPDPERIWRLIFPGRPLLANQVERMHWADLRRARAPWRDAAAVLARAAKIPKGLELIEITVQPRLRTIEHVFDTDGTSPAVKGIIDGLVVAGVIPDDHPAYVNAVVYMAARCGTGLPDELHVQIEALNPARRIAPLPDRRSRK